MTTPVIKPASPWRVQGAFLTVVLIWSTTPLTIQWSGQGVGFLFGVAARMALGLFCLLLVWLSRRRFIRFTPSALKTYAAVAMQLYGGMLLVYWSAQSIPSGWVSVLFGLTPMLTAIFSALWLRENSLTARHVFAYLLGLSGLAILFSTALGQGVSAPWAVVGVVLAASLHSLSAVMIKRIDGWVPPVQQVTGGLLIAVPLYLITWWFMDGTWPAVLPLRSALAIVYLGLIATTVGFAMYFYALTHLPATQVALITLITPMFSLWLGNAVNGEPLTEQTVLGSAAILLALMVHQFGRRKKKKHIPVHRQNT